MNGKFVFCLTSFVLALLAGKCLAEADEKLAALDKAKYEVIRAVVSGQDALTAIRSAAIPRSTRRG